MKKHKKTIGILGGMGPLASSNLYYNLIELAQKKFNAKQDHDFPAIFIYSLPLEGFDERGFVNPLSVKKQLISGVKKLEKSGSEFIVIACNTVHYFYNDMQRAIDVPILSIIKESSRIVRGAGYSKIGLLSSQSTKDLRIYQEELKKSKIETIITNNVQQGMINDVVLRVMSGKYGETEKGILKGIIENLAAKGAQAILLGCTELPLVISQEDVNNIEIFDSTQIITESALSKSLGVK